MVFKNFALVALAIAAQSLAAPANLSWNELVGSSHPIFPSQVDSIQTKSLNSPVILAELKALLQVDGLFDAVYSNYLSFHNKEASRFEIVQHRNIFKTTLLSIAKHNLEAKMGLKTWTQGVNKFADLTAAEAKSFLGGFQELPFSNASHVGLTQFREVSWKEYATPVKNQGQCGSCYAFSSIGLLETTYSINNGVKLDLSEQQVVDCDTKAGGCGGGNFYFTLNDYLTGGSAFEEDYPYQEVAGTCNRAVPAAGPTVLSVDFAQNNEDKLGEFLAQGPVAVGATIDREFQYYKGGVIQACAGPSIGNHAMVAVGAGSENGQNYWEIKNSWGADQGEEGYWRIAAGGNVCTIGMQPVRITSN